MSSIMLTIRVRCNPWDIDNITEEVIGNYLRKEIEKEIQGIELILSKMEYD